MELCYRWNIEQMSRGLDPQFLLKPVIEKAKKIKKLPSARGELGRELLKIVKENHKG